MKFLRFAWSYTLEVYLLHAYFVLRCMICFHLVRYCRKCLFFIFISSIARHNFGSLGIFLLFLSRFNNITSLFIHYEFFSLVSSIRFLSFYLHQLNTYWIFNQRYVERHLTNRGVTPRIRGTFEFLG